MTARPVDETVPYLLGVLGSAAEEVYARRVASLGLRPKHVAVLEFLASRGAASQREIAGAFAVTPALVVALVDDLEDAGLVRRDRDPHDRRRNAVAATDAGRGALSSCRDAAAEVEDELLAGLSTADRDRLRGLLARLRAAPDTGATDPPV